MANDAKTDPKNFYPRYATNNCADCNDIYYTKWGRVRQNNYDLFLPENNIIAACRNEKGFYPFRDERGLGMSELREPVDYVLESSGALSLGTTAGTDRSISAEFGGSTPHALSEYYDAATGIPASGAIDFSDFHGKSSSTTTFVWLFVNLGKEWCFPCLICDVCCTFNCNIYPSGCDEHGNLTIAYAGPTGWTTSPSCSDTYVDPYGDTPTISSAAVNGVYFTGGWEQRICPSSLACLRCWVDQGIGYVADWIHGTNACYSTFSYPPSWMSSCPNTFADRYKLVCGNVYSSTWDNTNYDLSGVDSDDHPMFCCVICWCSNYGTYGRNYYAQKSFINPCVCSGGSEWGCWGSVFTSTGYTGNKLVNYGDPSNIYSGAGRIVGINGTFSSYYGQQGIPWNNWSGGASCKHSKRLLTNSLVWASKGAL